MELSYLKSFYYVAKYKSFTKAADELDSSKGLVSRHVQLLEDEVKVQLFHRTTRSVNLTEAGHILFNKTCHIFSLVDEATNEINDATQELSGILRFTTSMSLGQFLLDNIYLEYKKICPEVIVELNFSNVMLDFFNEKQDVAIRLSVNLPNDSVAKFLGVTKNILVASSAFVDRNGPPETIQQLNDYPCLVLNHQSHWQDWNLSSINDDSFQIVGIKGVVYANQYSTIVKLVESNIGIANIPYYMARPLILSGQFVHLLANYVFCQTHPLTSIHAKHKRLPKKIRIFKQLVIEFFEKNNQYLI